METTFFCTGLRSREESALCPWDCGMLSDRAVRTEQHRQLRKLSDSVGRSVRRRIAWFVNEETEV